jgi:hypothetical protein
MPKKLFLVLAVLLFSSFCLATSTLTDITLNPNPAYNGEMIDASGAFNINSTLDTNSRFLGSGFGVGQLGWAGCQDFNLDHSVLVNSIEYRMQYSDDGDFCGRLDLYLLEDSNYGGKLRHIIARSHPDINNVSDGNFDYKSDGGITTTFRRCDWNFSNFWNSELTSQIEINLQESQYYTLCFYRDYNGLDPTGANTFQQTDANFFGQGHLFTSYNYDLIRDLNLVEYFSGSNPSSDIFMQIYSSPDVDYKLQCGDSNLIFNLCDGEFGASSPSICSFANPFDANVDETYADNNVFCRIQDSNSQNSNIESEVLYTSPPLSDLFECEGVENSTCSVDANRIFVNVVDGDESFTFSLTHKSLIGHFVNLLIQTSLSEEKSYYVYTGLGSLVDISFDNYFTHGVDEYRPLQKHYNASSDLWEYSQGDFFAGKYTKFYEFKINDPIFYWESIENSPDWTKAVKPEFDSDLRKDVYQVSGVANLGNLGEFEIPDVNSTITYDYFYLTLNGYSEYAYGTQNIYAGYRDPNNDYQIEEFELFAKGAYPYNFNDYNDSTYSFLVQAEHPVLLTQNNYPSQLYLGDYMISTSGYFLAPLTITDLQGNDLPVTWDDSNNIFKYLDEGQQFRIKTTIRGSEEIDYIAVSIYLNQVNDFNKVIYKTYDYNSGDVLYNFDEVMPAITDLTINAPDEELKVVVKIIFNSGYSEIASDWILFKQFPVSPADLSIFFSQVNRTIGSAPQGEIKLKSNYPDMIKGVYLHIYPVQDLDTNLYSIHLIKGEDFECVGFSCEFSYKVNDYVFPAAGTYMMRLVVDTYAETFSFANSKFYRQLSFVVNWKNFETARIFEVLDRGDNAYHADEAIPLVLQLRDSPDERGGYPNLKNDVEVVMRIGICYGSRYGNAEGSGHCNLSYNNGAPYSLDVNYQWTSFVYDPETGYNYWFFRNVFTDGGGNLLDGGPQEYGQMHLRVFAEIKDKTNRHNTSAIYPLLTERCKFYPYLIPEDPYSFNIAEDLNIAINLLTYYSHIFNMNQYAYGCQEFQKPIVIWDYNSGMEYPYYSQEARITLNNSRELLNPNQEAMVCLKPDNTGKYKNGLEQGLYCAVWYKLGEAIPDKFHLILSNENSDLAENNQEYTQYINVEIPYEYLLFNDPNLLKGALQVNQDTQINTVGDVFYYGFNKLFVGVANPLADITLPMFYNQDFNSNLNGAFVNIGADIDFNSAFDSRFLSGFLWYRVNGIKVINAYDYRNESKMDGVKLDEYVKWAKLNNVRLNEKTTKVQVYTSDIKSVLSVETPSRLVIYEEPESNNIDKTKLDANSQFTEPPKQLRFNIISDMVWGNEQKNQRLYIPFAIVTNLTFGNKIANFLGDTAATWGCLLAGECDPFDIAITWVFQNILIISIIILLLVIVSYVRRAWSQ